MSYQVLARKWRPQNFQEMVGQEHVLKALGNALDQDRLHHAYLFTGTRGVGKTTVARIFAKSLNCETGVTSQPCGQCVVCREIAEGRFVDLIEIDAASRTKVEDMRELLDNVQYAPTRSRFKIYLIDEVHMLSNSSFNALLKTLEEPPPHIKFLLATTDPQKLPVTILSRCLQFNMKNLSPERIVRHLAHVLQAEQVPAEEAALWELAKAAEGSMRDALSLTDQAIAFGNGTIKTQDVIDMLGTIEKHVVLELLQLVANSETPAVLAKVQHMAEFSPDYAYILQALAELLHRVAVEQAVPGAIDNSFGDQQQVVALARAMSAEDTQLFYQIALTSRKDLALAPDPRVGFEMALLRMLSFRPNVKSSREIQQGASSSSAGPSSDPESETAAAPNNTAVVEAQTPTVSPVPVPAEAPGTERQPAPSTTVNPGQTVSQPAPATATDAVPSVPTREPGDTALAAVEETVEKSAQASVLPERGKPSAPSVPDEAYPEYDDADFSAEMDDLVPVRESYDMADISPSAKPVRAVKPVDPPPPPPVTPAPVQAGPEQGGQDDSGADDDLGEDQEQELEAYEESAKHLEREFELPAVASRADAGEAMLQGQPWDLVIKNLKLTGMTQSLAQRCVMHDVLGHRIEFLIDSEHFDFFNEMHKTRLQTALSEFVGESVTIEVTVGQSEYLSPLQKAEKKRAELQADAEREIHEDVHVNAIIDRFGAFILDKSIEPIIREL